MSDAMFKWSFRYVFKLGNECTLRIKIEQCRIKNAHMIDLHIHITHLHTHSRVTHAWPQPSSSSASQIILMRRDDMWLNEAYHTYWDYRHYISTWHGGFPQACWFPYQRFLDGLMQPFIGKRVSKSAKSLSFSCSSVKASCPWMCQGSCRIELPRDSHTINRCFGSQVSQSNWWNWEWHR